MFQNGKLLDPQWWLLLAVNDLHNKLKLCDWDKACSLIGVMHGIVCGCVCMCVLACACKCVCYGCGESVNERVAFKSATSFAKNRGWHHLIKQSTVWNYVRFATFCGCVLKFQIHIRKWNNTLTPCCFVQSMWQYQNLPHLLGRVGRGTELSSMVILSVTPLLQHLPTYKCDQIKMSIVYSVM